MVTGMSPCGVCAVNCIFSVVPTMVPVTGRSPSGVPIVPDTASPSCLSVAVSGIAFGPICTVMFHLPVRPDGTPVLLDAPTAPAPAAGAAAAAPAAGLRLADHGT